MTFRTGSLLAVWLLAMVAAVVLFRSFWSLDDRRPDDALHLPTDDEWASQIAELAALGDTRAARRQWIAWNASRQRVDEDFRSHQNELWNGDFELELSGAPFGWQLPVSADVTVRQATSLSRDGRVLRLELGGSGVGVCDLRQQVVVEPGERYLLSFSARSEELEVPTGLRVEAIDAADGRLLYASLAIAGTAGWQGSLGSLEVPVETSLLWVRICSEAALDGPISGRLWLDSLVLQKVAGG